MVGIKEYRDNIYQLAQVINTFSCLCEVPTSKSLHIVHVSTCSTAQNKHRSTESIMGHGDGARSKQPDTDGTKWEMKISAVSPKPPSQ